MDAGNAKSYSYTENLSPYSEQIDLWNNSANVIYANTATATSPISTPTVERIVGDPNGYTYQQVQAIGSSTYTFSFWIKSVSGASGTCGVNWYTNTTGHNRQTVPVTGTWNRVSIKLTPPVSEAMNYYIYDNRSSLATITDVYVWGAQLQQSPYISNYVATTTSPITPSTNWVDLSRSGSTGTLTVSPVYNPNNGSFVFNGTSSYITLGLNSSILSYTNNFTTELWYQSNNTSPQLFYDRYPSGGYTILGYPGGNWKLTKYSIIDVYTGTIPTDTGWHHIAVTYSNSAGVTLYLDGQVNGVSTNTQNLSISSTYATLGVAEFGYLNGSISMIKMYNRVLSISEINQNFQAHRDRYGV
jgi:hypothetical protein